MSHLDGRVVAVTGGAGGFGRLTCQLAAERGARVVAGDVDRAGADETAAGIRAGGGQAISVDCDVCDRAQVEAMAAAAVDTFGAIDVWVNNAGVMPLAFFGDHARAADAWDRAIDINIKGVLNGIVAVYDQMIGQGRGHIVNISSIYGNQGTAGSGVYSATKAAVVVLSDALRIETQGRIKVTVIRPTGVMGTGLGAGVINPEASIGLTGQHQQRFVEHLTAWMSGTLPDALRDRDNPAYWSLEPSELAEQVISVIDLPWGVNVSDITIRSTGEDFTH